MKNPNLKALLPEYPSTLHLPYKPNSKGDRIASEQEIAVLFERRLMKSFQEKVDGASCGMAFVDDHPVARSRTKILRKGQEMENPSSAQFASVWNWMHDKKTAFKTLENRLGAVSVYGEWMVQQHGMFYDRLPDWFIAYDIYSHEKRQFLDPVLSMGHLDDAGFSFVPVEQYTEVFSYEDLDVLLERPSQYASGGREGVYIKLSCDNWIPHTNHHVRFKIVRQGFEQGSLLSDEMKRNKLA